MRISYGLTELPIEIFKVSLGGMVRVLLRIGRIAICWINFEYAGSTLQFKDDIVTDETLAVFHQYDVAVLITH